MLRHVAKVSAGTEGVGSSKPERDKSGTREEAIVDSNEPRGCAGSDVASLLATPRARRSKGKLPLACATPVESASRSVGRTAGVTPKHEQTPRVARKRGREPGSSMTPVSAVKPPPPRPSSLPVAGLLISASEYAEIFGESATVGSETDQSAAGDRFVAASSSTNPPSPAPATAQEGYHNPLTCPACKASSELEPVTLKGGSGRGSMFSTAPMVVPEFARDPPSESDRVDGGLDMSEVTENAGASASGDSGVSRTRTSGMLSASLTGERTRGAKGKSSFVSGTGGGYDDATAESTSGLGGESSEPGSASKAGGAGSYAPGTNSSTVGGNDVPRGQKHGGGRRRRTGGVSRLSSGGGSSDAEKALHSADSYAEDSEDWSLARSVGKRLAARGDAPGRSGDDVSGVVGSFSGGGTPVRRHGPRSSVRTGTRRKSSALATQATGKAGISCPRDWSGRTYCWSEANRYGDEEGAEDLLFWCPPFKVSSLVGHRMREIVLHGGGRHREGTSTTGVDPCFPSPRVLWEALIHGSM